jgi:predicted flap endonuclease-1-like 5' DNA nuclease
MPAELSANLPLILIGLALLVLGVWLIARSTRKARIVDDDSGTPLVRDVLAEGAAPAPRNQALIDAAPAAAQQADLSAYANTQAVAAAPLGTDAEAGPAITPTVVTPTTTAAVDDLSRIKGIGPKLVALLGELGVTSYAQIATWDAAAIERIDAQLGRFAGRITRDQWVEQAKLLAAGDEAGFAGKFGNNG